MVRECHDKKIKVHVWTVNEEADFERMRQLELLHYKRFDCLFAFC